MKLPDEDVAVADIRKEFAAELNAATNLFELIQKEVSAANLPSATRIHYCGAAVLTRLLRLHYSCVKLASHGLASEAKMAVRAIFENLLNLIALEYATDREEYARRWIAWDLINFMSQVKAEVRLHPENEPLFDEQKRIAAIVEADIRREAERVATGKWPKDPTKVRRFADTQWDTFRLRGPSMRNVRELAKHADSVTHGRMQLETSYEFVYPSTSAVLHGSDLSSLIKISKSQLVLKLAPTRDWIANVVTTSSVWLMRGAGSASRTLGFGPSDFEERMEAIVGPTLLRAARSSEA